MLTICKDSHLDHGLTADQLRWVLETFGDREGFFLETAEMPEELGGLSCALHGPLMGDEPVSEAEVVYLARGGREGDSRLCHREPRSTRMVTVIAGPHEGLDCVLYTVFGGPATPKEPTDPTLSDADREDSEAFWSEHALSLKVGRKLA